MITGHVHRRRTWSKVTSDDAIDDVCYNRRTSHMNVRFAMWPRLVIKRTSDVHDASSIPKCRVSQLSDRSHETRHVLFCSVAIPQLGGIQWAAKNDNQAFRACSVGGWKNGGNAQRMRNLAHAKPRTKQEACMFMSSQAWNSDSCADAHNLKHNMCI